MRAAELMVREAASLYEAGKDCGAEANMAKHLAAEASWAAADMCVQTHGGFGFAEEFDIERKFRETRLYTVAPISTNLVLSYIAEHVLGLPRSYYRAVMPVMAGLVPAIHVFNLALKDISMAQNKREERRHGHRLHRSRQYGRAYGAAAA